MINVKKTVRCIHIDKESNKQCVVNAAFNYEGELRRLYCDTHKLHNMINIITKKCEFITENNKCNTTAKFNYDGTKIGIFCDTHKLKDMINIYAEKCIHFDKETKKQCSVRSSFNYKDKKTPLYCNTHKLPDMINIVAKKCIYINKETNEQCSFISSFNYKDKKTPMYCSSHKKSNMINLKIKMCIKCGDVTVNKKTNYLCCDCNPVKTKKQKEKENAVRDLLNEHGVKFIQDKAVRKNGCLKRPDFLIEFDKYYLIIEVDEYQHKDYDAEDEKYRMELIKKALERPTKFIRYNPDNKNYNWRVKRKILMETVNKWINKVELENDDPIYLYYETI